MSIDPWGPPKGRDYKRVANFHCHKPFIRPPRNAKLRPPLMTNDARKSIKQILAILLFAIGMFALEFILWKQKADLGPIFWWLQVPIGLCTLSLSFLAGDRPAPRTTIRPNTDSITAGSADDSEEVREQLVMMAEQIEHRERELSERLKTFHEWMEFPQPLNVADPDAPPHAETSEKDKLLFKLIEEESKRVFDKILSGSYTSAGTVRIEDIQDEGTELVRRIARIYQP